MQALFFVIVLGAVLPAPCTVTTFNINLEEDPTKFPHYWEECVGSGHMALTSRIDWRDHLAMVRRDIGFKRIRGHGLLDDDMSTSLAEDVNSYINVDLLVDYLVSLGMRPILELSFMPNWLSSKSMFAGGKTVCHYYGNINPPKDYGLWGKVIYQLGEHLVQRYGEQVASEFLFEVWNEPGVAPTFWTGTQADYFKLYNYTARALKSVSSKLQVGGPATDCCPCWIQDFEKFNKQHNVPYDFISTHCYAGGEKDYGNATALAGYIAEARNLISSPSIPFVITEFSSNYIQGDDHGAVAGIMHDTPAEAAFLIDAFVRSQGHTQVLSYWAFSDVFAEPGFPTHNISFHGTFGLVNINGVPKPSYRMLQLLHMAGESRQPVTSTGPTETCNTLALHNGTHLTVFVYNYGMPGSTVEKCSAEVNVNNLTNAGKAAKEGLFIRIDEDNTNPRGYWIKHMGMFSGYPTTAQIEELLKASEIIYHVVPQASTKGNTLTTMFDVPARGAAIIIIPLHA